ncbi:MAG TPA: hemolysin family protein [Anaerolineales bacterium]|nr:hemolysin family protein [Anaerolineales bacterium]
MITVLTITLLVLFNALYVAAEFATVSARRTRINQIAQDGNVLARQLLPIINDINRLDSYVAACQVGITATSLLLGAYGQNVLAVRIEPLLYKLGSFAGPTAHSLSITTTLIVLTGLQMILGELLPKSIAIQYPEKVSLATLLPMRWSLRIFQPLIWIFNGSGKLLLKTLGLDTDNRHSTAHTLPEIQLLAADSKDAGILTSGAYLMLRNTLRLRNLTAKHIMTPRKLLMTAPDTMPTSKLLPICTESGFSRIPIYSENIDNIIGFVHIKDLLRMYWQGHEDITTILRKIIFINETLPAADIWKTLSAKRQYISIVLDMNEHITGIITYEDLIEEVFGELQDEFDIGTINISADTTNRIALHADMLISDVNEYLGTNLPIMSSDTIGDLVQKQVVQSPKIGDEIIVRPSMIKMRVEDMEGPKVTKVSVSVSDATHTINPSEDQT